MNEKLSNTNSLHFDNGKVQRAMILASVVITPVTIKPQLAVSDCTGQCPQLNCCPGHCPQLNCCPGHCPKW